MRGLNLALYRVQCWAVVNTVLTFNIETKHIFSQEQLNGFGDKTQECDVTLTFPQRSVICSK
jgi:hypothetical protein